MFFVELSASAAPANLLYERMIEGLLVLLVLIGRYSDYLLHRRQTEASAKKRRKSRVKAAASRKGKTTSGR